MLDLYQENWDILPNDIEVCFIDARHDYEGCKSDILNSLSTFKNLQYIIFDDYGVWEGVKQSIHEMLENGRLKLEMYIGLTDVPGSNGIVKNVHEGVICSVKRNFLTTI